jgi:hypothetical protein
MVVIKKALLVIFLPIKVIGMIGQIGFNDQNNVANGDVVASS